jgi:molecular chaperone GrpE (heat shock protein)
MIPSHPRQPDAQETPPEDPEWIQPEDTFEPDADESPEEDDLATQVADIHAALSEIGNKLGKLESHIDRLGRDEKVLTSLHEERRQYVEDHHNKHFVEPFLQTLIGIADRCRDTAKQRRRPPGQSGSEGQRRMKIAIQRGIAEQREADRIDVENLLSTFGVDPFEHHGKKFNASMQKCLRRVGTDQSQLNLTIAERHRPGYRRGERVIRHELVSVHIATTHKENENV